MRNYIVELKTAGALTQFPDSQKIFGALIYMFSEQFGSERATALTKAVLDKEIHLALSNLMPADYLPTPQDYLIDRMATFSDDSLKLKEKRRSVQERSYIKPHELTQVLTEPGICDGIFPYVKLQSQQQLRASIESVRYDISGLESKLYSVPMVVPVEIDLRGDGKEVKKLINSFCFYVQMDDTDFGADLLTMIQEAVDEGKSVILGKRASQGVNTFQFLSVTLEERPSIVTEYFLNMGMLLPDHIDFTSSTLKLFTSERRPFEMAGGWNKDFVKHHISFIAEGSMLFAPDRVENMGKSIKSFMNPQRDITFGNAFLYPLSLSERQVQVWKNSLIS